MTFYKVLAADGSACHGGSGKWHLPKGKRPGKWMPVIENIAPCERGYHLVTLAQLPQWLGETIWIAEGRGEHLEQLDKHVFSQAQLIRKIDSWDARTARLFACDCAERVLAVYEKEYPDDRRPRHAIEVARSYAHGNATDEELAAAGAAARYAGAAARYAARAAGWAAGDAAWDAARDAGWAAGDAAWAAAWDAGWAAGDAERTWQSSRLAAIFGLKGNE